MHKINLDDQIFVDYKISLYSALDIMNKIDKKLLIVLKEKKFYSVLSIGDIQRAILNKYHLSRSIEGILRTNITFCRVNDSKEFVINQMLLKRTELMPILDEDNNIIDLLYWDDIFGKEKQRKDVSINIPVVIMAGGKGTRLRPLTNIVPKPLLPIREKTIIEDIMDKFINIGCHQFYISVNYKSDLIRFHLNKLNGNNQTINFIEEKNPLGTAGSLYLLKNKIDSTFFVTNCDILIDQEIEDIYNFHKINKNAITIVSALKNYKIPYGIMQTEKDGVLISIDEKPEQIVQINTGMYILEPFILNELPDNSFFHMTELIEKAKQKKMNIGVFPITESSWQDIGTFDEYIKLLYINKDN